MRKFLSVFFTLIILITLVPNVSAAEGDKLIALTFDDGPVSPNTEKLLDGLKALGAHCTFFLVGYSSEYHQDLVRRMWDDGHQIASHTYDHPMLTSLNEEEIRSQLAANKKIFDEALGFECDYMLRPPYGDYNSYVLSVVKTPCFYWSMDTQDWQTSDPDAVYNAFLEQVDDGSIALLHDTHASSVDAALHAVETLQKEGYEFVTLAEMFLRRGIQLSPGEIYFSAHPGAYGTDDALQVPVIEYSGAKVTITGDERCSIYYTTNGEKPTPVNSELYTGPIYLSESATITAASVLDWNGLKSEASSSSIPIVVESVFTPIPMIETTPVSENTGRGALAWIICPLVILAFYVMVIAVKSHQVKRKH